MHIPALLAFILLALGNVALSGPTTQTNIETRTLDEIYKAALQESGTLRVAWGGDSEPPRHIIYSSMDVNRLYQSKPRKRASLKHSKAASQKSN